MRTLNYFVNHLYTLTNMPLNRFAALLNQLGDFDHSMTKLVIAFNLRTTEGIVFKRRRTMYFLRKTSFLLLIPFVFFAQDPVKRDQAAIHALHDDPKAYIAALEDPNREIYQKPNDVLDVLSLKPGEVVADIGAGSGYFTIRFSNALGVSGKVYAVDVSRDMIDYINRRILETGAKNVTTVMAAADDPRLPDASVDRIFICDTWHHIENRPQYLARLRKVLRAGGQIIMIDFQKRELPVGPPVDMKIAREDLIQQMESAGFHLAQEHAFLPYQYFLVFMVK